MLIGADWQYGTIGGGALEYQAQKDARNYLRRQCDMMIARIPLGPNLGQCCGGNVTLLYEYWGQGKIDALDTIKNTGRRLIDIEGTYPAPLPRPRGFAFSKGWLHEPVLSPLPQIWLYGAGHVGRAIVDSMIDLPYNIQWIDIDRNRFPSDCAITPIIAKQPANLVSNAPDDAIHLVMTHDHALDLEICHAVLSRTHHALGLIGSATKRARFITRLRNLGHEETQAERLICPIGNPALGKAPKAIAIGVVAQILSGI